MKDYQIIYETGSFYVLKGKVAYYVMQNTSTHSVTDSAYRLNEDGLSIAICRAKYLAKKESIQ